jgi:hypothetical protein
LALVTIRHAWEWTSVDGTAIAFSSPAGRTSLSEGYRVNLRFIDWIWHVRGSLALAPGQTSDEAFERLAPVFMQTGTRHERTGNTLTFHKKDPAAQDKMAVFNSGTLRVEQGVTGPVLRYHLISRFMLFCFLAPLLFLAFAQLTLTVAEFQKPDAASASPKNDKAQKAGNKAEAKKPDVQLNPIDKFLGAPAPDNKKKNDEKGGKRGKKPSTTPAYVFASFFAILYVIGRILEDRLVKRLFKKSLADSSLAASPDAGSLPSNLRTT